jgi:branched-chain amino acid transport system substrate-binding protein
VYEKLIRKSRAQGLPTSFYAVNSGSAQMAKHLGPLAHGMVFTQVVPSPWERKTAITREYQEEFAKQKPGREFSYGSLEGYVTAKALVAALRLAGRSRRAKASWPAWPTPAWTSTACARSTAATSTPA